jgi:hypothetical protein
MDMGFPKRSHIGMSEYWAGPGDAVIKRVLPTP